MFVGLYPNPSLHLSHLCLNILDCTGSSLAAGESKASRRATHTRLTAVAFFQFWATETHADCAQSQGLDVEELHAQDYINK